jgi:Kdo2-lipid IVA lauroyltransferase/acyltransferase
VQWKMARMGKWAERINRFGLRRGFPLLLKIAPRMPRWLNLLGARLVISIVMALHHRPKKAIARNLARVMGEPLGSRRVRAAVSQMLYNFACYWVDLFRFAQLPPERALALLDRRVGDHHLFAALEAGKGAILLTAHLGNWEMGGVLLRPLGVDLSVVYVPDQFEDVEASRVLLRRATGVGEIPIRPQESLSSLPVLRALRANQLVAMQGDRDFNDRGTPVEFFGQPAPFPLGPFHLALLTGAPLLPAFVVYTTGQRFEIEVGAPIRVDSTGDRQADARRGLEEWVRVLEAAVKRWPTQWYTFFDYWPEPGSPAAAASAAPPRERAL